MQISLTESSKIWKFFFNVVNDNGGLFDGVYTGCHASRHFFAPVKSLLSIQELLKRMDTRTHVRAIFFLIGAKIKHLNMELEKQELFHIFGNI